MPVYLCQAGRNEDEPWKHGIQVYPHPIETDSDDTTHSNIAIRKVSHAHVVLADDVCIFYDRYWVRLRWPGSKGGFAGYIAMGSVRGT